jgi:hypothetical protein
VTTLARVFLAVTICPAMGGFVGQTAGHALAVAGKADAGLLARWEVTGLLVGVVAGLVFAVLLIRCAVGFEGRLRGRIADPITIALGLAGVIGLLMRRAKLPPSVVGLETGITAFVWVLGFVFVVLAIKFRPRPETALPHPGTGVDLPGGDLHV